MQSWKGRVIAVATKTPTPIETLGKGLDYLEHHGHVCTVARVAMEDVEALVTAAERVRYLADEGEEQMKTAAWTIAWNDAAEALRAALVKFQGQP